MNSSITIISYFLTFLQAVLLLPTEMPKHDLSTAIMLDIYDEVDALIKDRDVNAPMDDESNYTAIEWAVANDRLKIVQLLLRKGAKLCDSLVPIAAMQGFDEMIEFLADHKANVNGTHGKFKRGALHLAILNGDSISTVELLLNFETNINQIDRYQKTPLHYATEMDREDIVMLLIQNGANTFARDKRGKRPADLAHINGHLDLEHFLEDSNGAVMHINKSILLLSFVLSSVNFLILNVEQLKLFIPRNVNY